MPLKFTGERYHPTEGGPMRYEHLHRYVLCTPLLAGRRVLDIACGEGYGSALLARHAAHVVGVDIDPQAVRHAQGAYGGSANLAFREGRADAIPLETGSVEVAVSFETIEHHDRHEEMLLEIRRVLAPGGLLVISSPDKRVYSEIPGYANPFHTRELQRDEFADLLGRHFRHTRLYGQRLVTGSAFAPLEETASVATLDALRAPAEGAGSAGFDWPGDPVYLIGLCSDAALPTLPASLFMDRRDDLYREQYRLEAALRDMQSGHEYLVGRIRELEARLAPPVPPQGADLALPGASASPGTASD